MSGLDFCVELNVTLYNPFCKALSMDDVHVRLIAYNLSVRALYYMNKHKTMAFYIGHIQYTSNFVVL